MKKLIVLFILFVFVFQSSILALDLKEISGDVLYVTGAAIGIGGIVYCIANPVYTPVAVFITTPAAGVLCGIGLWLKNELGPEREADY